MSDSKITRGEFITRTGAAAVTLPFISIDSAFAATERPNFVFILTDDQRYDAMSCAGHPFLKTPNIDRIAKEGALFRNAFVAISLCAPSRACFLTGRYAHSHGIKDNKTQLSDDLPTWPKTLQKAGYDTAFIGKWHQDGQEDPRPGFNRWVSFKGQGIYDDPMLDIAGEKLPEGVQGRSFKPLLSGKNKGWRQDWLYEYWYEKPFVTPTIRGVRTERWKYVEYPESNDPAELWDLKSDPKETKNLINDPSKAEALADMRKRLERLVKETK